MGLFVNHVDFMFGLRAYLIMNRVISGRCVTAWYGVCASVEVESWVSTTEEHT